MSAIPLRIPRRPVGGRAELQTDDKASSSFSHDEQTSWIVSPDDKETSCIHDDEAKSYIHDDKAPSYSHEESSLSYSSNDKASMPFSQDNAESTPENPSIELPPAVINPAAVEQERLKDNSSVGKPRWQTAFDEIKYFAGGLISHPIESTKRFAILRHSHGIVFYQGPYTSIAMTIFGDIPADRKMWLQRRGFSGKTGMKIGTLGTRSAWIDVTPATEISPDQLPASDERAWQRDIRTCSRRPAETHILRIPHLADDGYFRVVLCTGRKVLCPSPAFRLVSARPSPGVIRGASLSSMPLENGVKIGALVARTAANNAASGAIQPVSSMIKTSMPRMGAVQQTAVSTAYNASLAGRFEETAQEIDQRYEERTVSEHKALDSQVDSTSSPYETLPTTRKPFPVAFAASVKDGDNTLRTMSVNQDVEARLSGSYAAWVKAPEWQPAVVVATPMLSASVVKRKLVQVCTDMPSKKINVILLALLHREPSEHEQLAIDMSFTESLLGQPAWSVERVLAQEHGNLSEKSLVDRAADLRILGQQQIDRVPLHKLGIRLDSARFRDQIIGNGGVFVRR